MEISEKLTADEVETYIKDAVCSHQPLVITTFTLPREIELWIETVLVLFLKEIKREEIKDYILYCVQELSVNAKKANTKRVYFLEQHLDITNLQDYVKGMKSFKRDTLTNIRHYLELQKKSGLYIKIILQMKKNTILIEVRNNVEIAEYEILRIKNKLLLAHQFNSLEEAMAEVDDSEGSGLGLIILILMMKKLGFSRECLKVEKEDQETVASIRIPLDNSGTAQADCQVLGL
jgi:hypothetical protein